MTKNEFMDVEEYAMEDMCYDADQRFGQNILERILDKINSRQAAGLDTIETVDIVAKILKNLGFSGEE